MNIMGFWAIIFSAVVLAHIFGAAVGTLLMCTKWYRKLMTKISWRYTEDLLGQMVKTDENVNEGTSEDTNEDAKVIKLDWLAK